MNPTEDLAARPARVERHSIDVVPDSERHGSPVSQFTLWFGANMQVTAIVDGALAVVFGADARWAILGLLIGNIAGGADGTGREGSRRNGTPPSGGGTAGGAA